MTAQQDQKLQELCGKGKAISGPDFFRAWFHGSIRVLRDVEADNRYLRQQILERDEALDVCAQAQLEYVEIIADYDARILQLQKEILVLKKLLDERGNLRRTA